jgi:hypothetical protein
MKHFVKLVVALVVIAATVVRATPAIISNQSLASEHLDGATVKAVFLGKKVSWDSGGRVVLAVLKDGPVADEFLLKATGLNARAFLIYWTRLVSTGGGTMPKSFEKEEDLRKFVAGKPGAIGFLDGANVNSSVATLLPK